LVRKLTGGVEREVRPNRGLPLRVERQHVLQPLNPVHDHEAREAEREHRHRVDRPVLLVIFSRAAQRIDAALDRAQHRRKERTLAVEDARQVAAECPGDQDHQHRVNRDLQPAVEGHQNFSGRISA
jgi:hypothetical protein